MGAPVTVLALVVLAVAAYAEDGPSVYAGGGAVRGRWVAAERGAHRFAAFLGIPYARPPVGPLRFQMPERVPNFTGPLDATTDPPVCPQLDGEQFVGQEDCLYLNVYVPEGTIAGKAEKHGFEATKFHIKNSHQHILSENPKAKGWLDWLQAPVRPSGLPVVFVVHGGRFEVGSGRLAAFGPHFLLGHRDVVVVAANFRQGPLGFLSLDSAAVPGNAGLKDLAAALQWVRDNVALFGGDPARVTALGWSTGASAVHLLSLLPATRGLMQRAVLLGGHAVSPRAYTEQHVRRATAVAAVLGAADNGTEAVAAALRSASAEDLLRACKDPRVSRVGAVLALPSPERRQGGGPALLRHDPESLLRQPQAPPLPMLMSLNGREGTFAYNTWGLESQSAEAVDATLPLLMPGDLLPGADTGKQLGLADAGRGPGALADDAAARLATLVRDEYADGDAIASGANGTERLVEFLGDVFIYASASRALRFMASSSSDAAPLHLYRFLVDDDYNYVKRLRDITLPGSSHTDDVGYLGRFDANPNLNQDMSAEGVAPATLRNLVQTVLDFVHGRPLGWAPVPQTTAGWNGGDALPVFQVGPGLRGQAVLEQPPPHSAFWAGVYDDLRADPSSIGRH